MTLRPAMRPSVDTIWFTSAFSLFGIGVAIAMAIGLSSCGKASFDGDSGSAPTPPTVTGDGDDKKEDLAANGSGGQGTSGSADAGGLGNTAAGGTGSGAVPLTDAIAECHGKGGNWNGMQCIACGPALVWNAQANSCVMADGSTGAGDVPGSGGPAITADQIQTVIPLITTFMNNIPNDPNGGPFGGGPGCGC